MKRWFIQNFFGSNIGGKTLSGRSAETKLMSPIPIWQLVLRTIVVYGVALLIIRVAKRRFMGGFTTFDILLGFVVGSVFSRAITGTIQFCRYVFYSFRAGYNALDHRRYRILCGQFYQPDGEKFRPPTG